MKDEAYGFGIEDQRCINSYETAIMSIKGKGCE